MNHKAKFLNQQEEDIIANKKNFPFTGGPGPQYPIDYAGNLWLTVIDYFPVENPLCAILVRITRVFEDYGNTRCTCHRGLLDIDICSDSPHERLIANIQQLSSNAAQAFPGPSLTPFYTMDSDEFGEYYTNGYDPEQYAYSVLRREDIRVHFPDQLKSLLKKIEEYVGSKIPIQYCLPVMDGDLWVPQTLEFAYELRNQKWLTIYLIVDESTKATVSELCVNYTNIRVITAADIPEDFEFGLPKNW